MTVLIIVAAVLCALPLIDMVRRADFRQMGLRNVGRRPIESTLIILGSALGTAVICAALLVGDTFGHSVRDIARAELGEVDIIVQPESAAGLQGAVDVIRAAELDGVDGVVGARRAQAAIAKDLVEGTSAGAVEPTAELGAIEFSQAASFGSTPGQLGLGVDVATPATGEVVLHPELADTLGAAVGDQVQLFAYGQDMNATVTAITSGSGLGGFADAWVAPELLFDAESAVLVSLDGGVFDTVDASEPVQEELEAVLMAAGVEADTWGAKASLIEDAEATDEEFTTIFTVVGGFSVIAGVVLLVNLFVMLSEERKPSLGVLRAVGWKRGSLVRAFGVEGLLYAIPSALIGALVGVGLGWILVLVTRQVFFTATDGDFEILFNVPISTLAIAFLCGVILSMASIWVTSWRISRLNIISAIRDIAEPKRKRSKMIANSLGLLAIVAGAALGFLGFSSEVTALAFLSAPVALVGVGMLLRQFIRPSLIVGVLGTIIMIWGAVFIPMMPESLVDDIDIEFFLLLGVVVVGGGVALTTVAGPVLQRVLNFADRPRVPERMGMAYPVSRMFRTASSLAMYSLIIFSLAFMAVFANGLEGETDMLVENSAADHDVLFSSNDSSPVDPAAMLAIDGVSAVNPLLRGGVEWEVPDEPGETDWWTTSGVSPEFAEVGVPALQSRLDRFGSDAEALRAVATSDNLLLVPEWFLDLEGRDAAAGDVVYTAKNGERQAFEIAGVLATNYVWNGVWMSADALGSLDANAAIGRTYVAVDDGADASTVAKALETTFVRNGVQAETFQQRISDIVATDLALFGLLRGYLLLGLVIGIAGLAVTLFRAVRERRRQIGMLRAMGLPAGGVRRWFMTEATFISVMGIVTGIGLGILTGWLVTTQSDAVSNDPLPFSFPLAPALVICAIPFVASTIAAIIPAQRAANLLPSEALRLSD